MKKEIDADALAIALFKMLTELETAYPGLAERYGWVRLTDVETFAEALMKANHATKPEGLQ